MSAALDSIARTISRVFAAALWLYPARVRREYAAEMQTVFEQRAHDAARRGPLALLAMAFQEALDLPLAAASAHLRLAGGPINRHFPATSDQVPWVAALLSLVPLFLAGAGRIIVFYKSGFGGPEVQEAWYFFPYLALCALVALACLALGALRKFPRWSYPYVFTLVFALTDLYNTYTYHYGWSTIGQNSLFLFLAVTLLALYLPPLRDFYRNIRQDWTLLSYCLFGFVLFFLSLFDQDEYPVVNLALLLPSLIALCAALAHLRIRQAPVRILVLVVGTLTGLFVWLYGFFTGGISIFIGIIIGTVMMLWYGLILITVLLSPLLVILIKQADAAAKN